nr:6915_t:CDS:2 [Entrophospora candida]
MSSYYIGEDDSFTNINESSASTGTNSLASTSMDLEGKFTAITTDDNVSNMVSGSSLLKESLNIERISYYTEKLRPIYDVATCWSSTYNSWVRLAPPPPPSPSSNSSFIVSTSSIVHTSPTISSSHALISPSPPLFNEDVDSSSAVNNNESNSILYLVDVLLLALDICICIYLKSTYEERKADEPHFIYLLNYMNIILSTIGMIIGCDKTNKAIIQGLITIFFFWPILIQKNPLQHKIEAMVFRFLPSKIELEKEIIISAAFVNFINAVRLYNNSKDYNFYIEIFKIIMILISNYDEFLKPILLIIPSTVQGVILYPKYDNIIVIVTIILSYAATFMEMRRKVQMSQAREPQISPKLNEFLTLFFVELGIIFLKFCVCGVYGIGMAIIFISTILGLLSLMTSANANTIVFCVF